MRINHLNRGRWSCCSTLIPKSASMPVEADSERFAMRCRLRLEENTELIEQRGSLDAAATDRRKRRYVFIYVCPLAAEAFCKNLCATQDNERKEPVGNGGGKARARIPPYRETGRETSRETNEDKSVCTCPMLTRISFRMWINEPTEPCRLCQEFLDEGKINTASGRNPRRRKGADETLVFCRWS